MDLRPYQTEALQALFDYWRAGGGNPLLAKATGTGKSVVIAFLIKQLLSDYPNLRVLVTAPNKELIDQDVKELLKNGMARRSDRYQLRRARIARYRRANLVLHGEFDLPQSESDRAARAHPGRRSASNSACAIRGCIAPRSRRCAG